MSDGMAYSDLNNDPFKVSAEGWKKLNETLERENQMENNKIWEVHKYITLSGRPSKAFIWEMERLFDPENPTPGFNKYTDKPVLMTWDYENNRLVEIEGEK